MARAKKPNKRSAPNFSNNCKKSGSHSKEKWIAFNIQIRKAEPNNSNDSERNQLRVTLVGDSQVNCIDELKLCNDDRKVEK